MTAPRRSAAQTAVVAKPDGCRFGDYDVYARTDGVLIVVDTRLEPGAPGRVVATASSLEDAKKKAQRLAGKGVKT